MPRRGIVFAAIALLLSAGIAPGQVGPPSRLSGDRLGDIQTGTYAASTGQTFSLDRYDDKFLMRFGGEPEIFVLYPDHGSLGAYTLVGCTVAPGFDFSAFELAPDGFEPG